MTNLYTVFGQTHGCGANAKLGLSMVWAKLKLKLKKASGLTSSLPWLNLEKMDVCSYHPPHRIQTGYSIRESSRSLDKLQS